MNGRIAALTVVALLYVAPAWAHKPSDSYVRITREGGNLQVEWDIALKDLEYVVGLDADGDGEITWGELKARRDAIASHAISRLRISADDQGCVIRLTRLMAARHSDGGYAVLVLRGQCPPDAAALNVNYRLMFDVDPTHRGLLLYTDSAGSRTAVFSIDEPVGVLRRNTTNAGAVSSQFFAFVRTGVWHILIGFDHILFLATLLLPAVLERRDRRWTPVAHLRPTFASVLKIVSVFTVAHSLTLWLAVTGYATLPSRFVESAIALSIVLTALNNVRPFLPLPGWAIAFLFGLVHGFGFANVLLDLGLTNFSLATALLGFNVGVEVGQLAIVLAILPLAFLTRTTVFYRSLVFRFGSVLIGVVGAVWMVERMFNLRITGI